MLCHCSNGYECPHRCWYCSSEREGGCEEWCHIRPFEDEEDVWEDYDWYPEEESW